MDSARLPRQSGNDAQQSGLRFRSQQDALNFAEHSAEEGNRWFSAHSVNFAKRYEKGELDIVLNFSARPYTGKYHLIFFAIPMGREHGQSAGSLHVAYSNPLDGHTDGDDQPMFAAVANPVECPDKVVPSFVWLERAKKRHNLRRQIFASATLDNVRLKLHRRIGDGKVSSLGVGLPRRNRSRVASLIKDGTQTLGRLKSKISEPLGNGLGEFEFVKLRDSVRVGLSNLGAWILLPAEEGFSPRIEVADLFLCAREPTPGTLERIKRHG